MRHDWRTAFLAQARSDYRILQILHRTEGVERCHRLHYLQMAAEKVAKGFLTRGAIQPPTVHESVVEFLYHAHLINGLQRACQIKSARQFKEYVKGLVPLAREVEQLVPEKMSQRPNPEYPWESATGIYAPCEHDFPEWHWERDKPRLIRMMEFINACLRLT